jgi:hypothetical protein
MKRTTTMSATALFATLAFGIPSYAASADAKSPEAKKMSAAAAEAEKDADETIDAHIKHLHDKLQITSAQEGKWKQVAEVMEDNSEKIGALTKARGEKAKTMSAVEDLKSYAEITEAHEVGVGKLLPVFTALYDSMSDAQKKAADVEFREHHHHHEGHS